MFGLTAQELAILRPLTTPSKIQDFLNAIPKNFETAGDTCMSPRSVLKERKAQCMEGAMLAALALRIHGHRPLVMDLKSTEKDFDHVVALFQKDGCWGAISKTNYAVLRYREPMYRTIRELALSYFHEYFLDDGRKTLRSYSAPVDLSRLDRDNWMTNEEEVWFVPAAVDDARHYPLLSRSQIARLRRADAIERQAGKLREWKKGQL